MKSPGLMLREAREERGLTLSDVAAMTRIPKTMLSHLESDRFDEYVAEVFVRGHLRNYARELRLDSENVLQAYERHVGAAQIEGEEATPEVVTARPMSRALAAASGPIATSGASSNKRSGRSRQRPNLFNSIRPSHMVAVVFVLLGIFVMVSFLSSNRATAQDPAALPEADESVWEMERDIEETRWLLERSEPESE